MDKCQHIFIYLKLCQIKTLINRFYVESTRNKNIITIHKIFVDCFWWQFQEKEDLDMLLFNIEVEVLFC